MNGDLEIELHGERVTLLPERALFWHSRQTLCVADLHWGKAATFRAASLPLPVGTTRSDLARLTQALERTRARRLILLSDLIHARAGRAPRTLNVIAEWRAQHSGLEILLVRGNHDRRAGDPPDEWNIYCVDEPFPDGPFVFRHQPERTPEGYTLAGHVHPAALLNGIGQQQLRLPCFWFGANLGVLPAFGSFTGAASVTPARDDRVYVIADDEVVAVH